MDNWNRSGIAVRRMCALALCGTLLSGCGVSDITLPGINQDPTANAGVDRTVDVGQRVTLDAFGSTDADDDALTYSWQQRSGPPVTLDNPNSIQPSFVPLSDGFYEFALTVTDGRGGSDVSVVRVFVGNVDPATCPRADAGMDQTVNEGAAVRLRGRNSADPSGRPLAFDWFQLSGPQVSVNGVFITEPSFAAPQSSGANVVLEFELTVTNEQGCTGRDVVVITIRDRNPNDPCNGVICQDDGLFCNGVESCANGDCVSSGEPCGGGETCDEVANTCEGGSSCTTDADCDDNAFCNGDETCVNGNCVTGNGPCEAGESCDEDANSCETVASCTTDTDCDDQLFCNGDETCVDSACVSGSDPCLADETCDEENGACTTSVPSGGAPGLVMVMVVSPDPARLGEALDVELTITNDEAFLRTDIVVTLEFPEGLDALATSLLGFRFDGSSCQQVSSFGRSCTAFERARFLLGDLEPGEGTTISVSPRIAAAAQDGTMVTFKAEVTDATGKTSTTEASVAVLADRELRLSLLVDRDPVSPNGLLTYTMAYGVREGSLGIASPQLTASIPDGTTFVSATNGGSLSGSTVDWPLLPLNAGTSGEVEMTVQVDPGTPAASILVAEAVFENLAGPEERVTYAAATHVQADDALELAMVVSPDPARQGETLNLELTVTNDEAFLRTGIVVTLEFPDGLEALSTSLLGPRLHANSCQQVSSFGRSCTGRERAWFMLGDLKPGEGTTISIPPRVAGAVLDGAVLTFEAAVVDATGKGRRTEASITVLENRELQLKVVSDRDPVPANGLLTYTIAYGVLEGSLGIISPQLTAEIPDGTTLVLATNGGMLNGDTVEWPLLPLNAGTSGEVEMTVQVDPGTPVASILVTEAVFENLAGPQERVAYAVVMHVQADDALELTMVVSPDPVRPGETLDLELTVTNDEAFLRTDIVVTLEFPGGLDALSTSLLGPRFHANSCQQVSSFGRSCTSRERAFFLLGDLEPGEATTISIPPRVADAVLNGKVISFEAAVTDATGTTHRTGTILTVLEN